jgi:hypothetical protein
MVWIVALLAIVATVNMMLINVIYILVPIVVDSTNSQYDGNSSNIYTVYYNQADGCW